MGLIKTSLLNGIAVVVKMLTLLGINKILAIYVGPTGYAVVGNFQNAVQMITTFASGAIDTAVVKYTAEYHDDEAKQQAVWRTAGTVAIIFSVFMGILIAVFSRSIALWFFKNENFTAVFFWFAVTIGFLIFNTLFLAILKGKKNIYRYMTANIAGSFFSLAITGLMTIELGLQGTLISLVIYPSIAFFITIFLCYKEGWFRFSYFFGRLDKWAAVNLAKFTAMALVSAICAPITLILIRNHLGETLGWNVAGYWEAMWRLSTAYLMLVTTTLSVYYLPRLSEIKGLVAIKKEIIQGYKIILPITAVCGFFIYLSRDFIISTLFTSDFFAMRELFAWQMVGDSLKIGSWILAYLMLGKAMAKIFIVTEVLFCISFYVLTYVFIEIHGLKGVALAHAVNYFFYWVLIGYLVSRKLKISEQKTFCTVTPKRIKKWMVYK